MHHTNDELSRSIQHSTVCNDVDFHKNTILSLRLQHFQHVRTETESRPRQDSGLRVGVVVLVGIED